MANEIKFRYSLTLRDLYVVIIDLAGEIYTPDTSTFGAIASANWDDYIIELTEQDGTQIYYGDEPSGLDPDIEYNLLFYEQGVGGSIVDPGDDHVATGVLHERADIYHADIETALDNTNSQDEYTAIWFRNGSRITSGITSPTIQVVKRSDGTDLVASVAMTQIGSTGSYKYDEGTNRITLGEAVVVIVSATIDSKSRSFARVVNRDS